MQRRDDVDAQQAAVLDYLEQHTYDETAERFRTSRGKVYTLAIEAKRRKHEARIMERATERERRQMEFLHSVINSVMKTDVLDFLDGLPDNSIDMHITSIPYNVSKKYGDSEEIDKRAFHYYLGFLLQVLSEYERTMKPGGVLFLQVGSTKDREGTLYPLDCLLFEHLRQMLTFQSRVAWVIPHGLTPKSRLAERYETALVFSKGPACTFNPTVARSPQKQPDKRAFKGPRKGQLSGHPLGAWPSNVWYIPNVGHNHPDATFGRHPAQFPMLLAERAILLYTLPGQLVCDSFMGSGTSAAAAKKTGRCFTGCDLFYTSIREKRLAALMPDTYFRFPGVTDESLAVWEAEAVVRNHTPKKPIAPETELSLFTAIEAVMQKATV